MHFLLIIMPSLLKVPCSEMAEVVVILEKITVKTIFMRKNAFYPANSFAMFCGVALYLLIACSQVACNYPVKERAPIRNWITLDIKYKANTTAELRDITLRSIEKLLVDSFTAQKSSNYYNYPPIITISKSPSIDTLRYDINIGPSSNSTMVQSLSQHYLALPLRDSTAKPPCYCSTNCGVCEILNNYMHNPPPDHPEFKYIDSISFTTPEIEFKK